jgi:hypothetical protein
LGATVAFFALWALRASVTFGANLTDRT